MLYLYYKYDNTCIYNSKYWNDISDHIDFDKKNGQFDLFSCNENPDIVFHLAANCKINKCIDNPSLAFENSKITENVLEFCRFKKAKIVYFSSSRILNKERNV